MRVEGEDEERNGGGGNDCVKERWRKVQQGREGI